MYPEAFDLTEVFRCAAGTLSASCGHALRGTMAHTCRGLLEARPAVILVFDMLLRAPASPCVRLGKPRQSDCVVQQSISFLKTTASL